MKKKIWIPIVIVLIAVLLCLVFHFVLDLGYTLYFQNHQELRPIFFQFLISCCKLVSYVFYL